MQPAPNATAAAAVGDYREQPDGEGDPSTLQDLVLPVQSRSSRQLHPSLSQEHEHVGSGSPSGPARGALDTEGVEAPRTAYPAG